MTAPGRTTRGPVGLLVLALLATGCGAPDDELAPRPEVTVTITRSPSPAPSAVPSEVPVGGVSLPLDAPAWATAGRLRIGRRSADVSPRSVDAFVVARGGVYFLDGTELWFTDLRTVRATGLTTVVGLGIDASREQLRVTLAGRDGPTTHLYDTRVGGILDDLEDDGAQGPGGALQPLHQRQGRAVEVSVGASVVDLTPAADDALVRASLGPGRFGLVGVDRRPLQPFESTTGRKVSIRPRIAQFRLGGWTGGTSFYGVSYVGGIPDAVVGCELAERRCGTLGVVPDGLPVVFDTGVSDIPTP